MRLSLRLIVITAVAGLIILAAGLYALGIIGYERYTGYLAPVWAEDGKRVYYIQRETSGFIWGCRLGAFYAASFNLYHVRQVQPAPGWSAGQGRQGAADMVGQSAGWPGDQTLP